MMSKVRNVSKEPDAAHEGLGGRENVPSPRRWEPDPTNHPLGRHQRLSRSCRTPQVP
jgi:hypothetical protein